MQAATQPSMRRSWLTRGAAILGLCLAWASCLGAATVWPRWNQAQMLDAQVRERQTQVAEQESRLDAARLTLGTDTGSRARGRVLSRDEVPAFLRELRARAGVLGAKVVALDQAETVEVLGALAPVTARGRLAVEGSFRALYEVLRYLENRRVFVAIDRAEVVPVAADGRLKAVFQFQFLVVPVTGGTEEQA